ncbi:MAG: hypothetical protein RIK87_14495 [Fuerstiella sp.]
MQRFILILSALLIGTSTADAHPGHGSPAAQDGLWHYLTSPVHAGPIVLAAIIALVAAGRVIRWRNRDRK